MMSNLSGFIIHRIFIAWFINESLIRLLFGGETCLEEEINYFTVIQIFGDGCTSGHHILGLKLGLKSDAQQLLEICIMMFY